MLLDNMPHLCNAYRRVRTSDSMAGSIDTFTLIFSSKECWRQSAGDQVVMWWSQRGVNISDVIYFNEDPGLDENCVLTFSDISGFYFDIQSYGYPDDKVGLNVVWRMTAQRVKGVVT